MPVKYLSSEDARLDSIEFLGETFIECLDESKRAIDNVNRLVIISYNIKWYAFCVNHKVNKMIKEQLSRARSCFKCAGEVSELLTRLENNAS